MSRNYENNSNYQDSDAGNTREKSVQGRFVTSFKLSIEYLLGEIKQVVMEKNGLDYEDRSSLSAHFRSLGLPGFRETQSQGIFSRKVRRKSNVSDGIIMGEIFL